MSATTDRTRGHPCSDRSDPRAARATRPRIERRRALVAAVVCTALLLVALAAVAHAQRGGRKVSGTVVAAATQQPVANARVQYAESGQPRQTTTTDAKGYFEFPAGRLGVVTVTAQDFGTARRKWPPAGTSLQVALAPPAIVRGAVSDAATGRALTALVTVMVQHPGNFVSQTVNAAGGAFEIEDLPPGPALVTARSAGFAPYIGSVTVEAGKVRDARIRLLLQAQATGHVHDAAGTPVTGALVVAAYAELAGAGILEGLVGGRPLTGTDGAFALRDLVPDTPIALRAELDGRRSPATTITVRPGTTQSGVVLTLP